MKSIFSVNAPKERLFLHFSGSNLAELLRMVIIFYGSPEYFGDAVFYCCDAAFVLCIYRFVEKQYLLTHQLFVVFAREHSDIQIVPINMNEDITKMYNHVITS